MTLAAQITATAPAPRKRRRTHADDIVEAMQRSGMLPFRVELSTAQAQAMCRFFADLHAGWGSSGSLSPIDLDKVFAPSPVRGGMAPCATVNMERCQRVISGLREHERALVRWLVLARERGNVSLATLGREHSGIEQVHTACGIAAGMLRALGQTLAELYDQRNCWPQR